MQAELRPGQRLDELVERPGPARERQEGVRADGHLVLALVHGRHDNELARAVMRDLALDHRLRDHADHLAAVREGRVGQRAHHPAPPAAVDDPDPAAGDPRSDVGRELGVGPVAGAEIDGDSRCTPHPLRERRSP